MYNCVRKLQVTLMQDTLEILIVDAVYVVGLYHIYFLHTPLHLQWFHDRGYVSGIQSYFKLKINFYWIHRKRQDLKKETFYETLLDPKWFTCSLSKATK